MSELRCNMCSNQHAAEEIHTKWGIVHVGAFWDIVDCGWRAFGRITNGEITDLFDESLPQGTTIEAAKSEALRLTVEALEGLTSAVKAVQG